MIDGLLLFLLIACALTALVVGGAFLLAWLSRNEEKEDDK